MTEYDNLTQALKLWCDEAAASVTGDDQYATHRKLSERAYKLYSRFSETNDADAAEALTLQELGEPRDAVARENYKNVRGFFTVASVLLIIQVLSDLLIAFINPEYYVTKHGQLGVLPTFISCNVLIALFFIVTLVCFLRERKKLNSVMG